MAKKAKADNSKVWKIMAIGAGVAGGKLAAIGMSTGWKAATGKTPPADAGDPDVQLREALLWAAASATAAALVKAALTRGAANYFRKSTGELPPPMRKADHSV